MQNFLDKKYTQNFYIKKKLNNQKIPFKNLASSFKSKKNSIRSLKLEGTFKAFNLIKIYFF